MGFACEGLKFEVEETKKKATAENENLRSRRGIRYKNYYPILQI